MRVQIYIEHDIIIRHFIHSGVLKCLEDNHTVEYVFPDGDPRVKSELAALGLPRVRTIPVDRARVNQLRYLSKVVALRRARKNALAYGSLRSQWRRLGEGRAYRGIWLRSQPVLNDLYRRLVLRRIGPYSELAEAIKEFEPDVVVHPSVLEGLFINDLCEQTRIAGIPFVALMNSWDNPTTKATVMGHPDLLGVWGEQSRSQAVEFLGMPKEQVAILGAAQFQVFRTKPDLDRTDICRAAGIDPGMHLLLYAGSSKSVNEMEHLKLLDESVENGSLPDANIIYRPHPWRAPAPGEMDFHKMGFRNVVMDPGMSADYISPDSQDRPIHLSDYRMTHNILSAVDVLLSNVSTIMLEAALHGLPVGCMSSDEDMASNDFLRAIFDSLFFQEFLERLEVPRIRGTTDIPGVCRQLLAHGREEGFGDRQSGRASYFVDTAEPGYSTRLLALLDDVAGSSTEVAA